MVGAGPIEVRLQQVGRRYFISAIAPRHPSTISLHNAIAWDFLLRKLAYLPTALHD